MAGALAVIATLGVASALAYGVVGAAPDQGRRHRTSEQDCADGLGHDGQGRSLQATHRTGAVNEIAPDSRQIIALAARYRLPTVYPWRFFAELGGLLSYGNEQIDSFRLAATYVDRILRGAKAG